MDHEWNGSGYVSEMKWDVRQDDKWNEKLYESCKRKNWKSYWWNTTMRWSETEKIKWSELRWDDEFAESKL